MIKLFGFLRQTSNRPKILAAASSLLVLVLGTILSMAARQPVTGSIQGSDNKDRLSNSVMHTLPLEAVVADHKTGRDGQYIPSRVISTVSPVVVRQNDPKGPTYQEAIGYSFLLNSPKYPGLCKMDDGTLVLTLTAALSGETVRRDGVTFLDENTRTDVILFSRDSGRSWSQPRRIPGYRTTPMNLGGRRLMLRGWNSKIDVPESYRFWFSEDGGQTWSKEEPVAAFPDGRRPITDVAPNMLIEGDTIRFMFYISGVGTVMRPYNHVEHTWGEPYFFPKKWMEFARCSEASLARAANGDLVASFRSTRPGIPSPSDHWRSILTARSTDDGKTWTMPDVHSLYGHVHHSLLTFECNRPPAHKIGKLEKLGSRISRDSVQKPRKSRVLGDTVTNHCTTPIDGATNVQPGESCVCGRILWQC